MSIFSKKKLKKAENGEKEIHSYHHNAETSLWALTVMNFKSLSRQVLFDIYDTLYSSVTIWQIEIDFPDNKNAKHLNSAVLKPSHCGLWRL